MLHVKFIQQMLFLFFGFETIFILNYLEVLKFLIQLQQIYANSIIHPTQFNQVINLNQLKLKRLTQLNILIKTQQCSNNYSKEINHLSKPIQSN